ncbi:MAG: hypothetical protein WDO70_10255 [Alphaproteobacteria bacterium]
MPLPIVAASGEVSQPGDFNAYIRDGALVLPEDIALALAARRITTAERFVEFAFNCPGSLAAALQWRLSDVARARPDLITALQGHIDERKLTLDEPLLRGFGPPIAPLSTRPPPRPPLRVSHAAPFRRKIVPT